MEKQTAVEWLAEIIRFANKELYAEMFEEIKKAKQMEKKQIIIAYMKNLPIEDGVITAVQKAENYYNETFKN